jgi:hypothetical protein
MNDGRIVCTATTKAGNPCQNTADGADGVHCTAHQRRGCPPGRVIRPNSSHRTLVKRARKQWSDRLGLGGEAEGPAELARVYGGYANWWSRIITTQRDTPKFLHGAGVARLVRYLASPVTSPIVDVAHVPEFVPESTTPEPTLEEAHEEWRKSQEAEEDEVQFSALQANVHDLSARLLNLESMVAEILQTLTKGA